MSRSHVVVLALCAALLGSGCSLVAPRYSPSLQNVQAVKDANIQATSVGKFEVVPGKDNANPISLRGSSLTSPYEGSYGAYLAEALKQDLSLAGKYAVAANLQISGALQQNDINIPAVGSGSGNLQARFVVTGGGAVRYDQVKSIHDVWDSSFVGAVAIPRAQERYPLMVQKLLTELLSDQAFLQALR